MQHETVQKNTETYGPAVARAVRVSAKATDAFPHLRVYQGSEGEIIEQVCEVLPNVGVSVFP